MTPEKREEIATLVADMHGKKVRYDGLAMMNTPCDHDEAKKARIELELARAEYYEAANKLDAAMPSPPTPAALAAHDEFLSVQRGEHIKRMQALHGLDPNHHY